MIVGLVGALLLFLVLVARLAIAPRAERHPALPSGRPVPADDATEVSGIARLATVEIASPITRTACLAFGLRGTADGGTTDDPETTHAEGGDFDLELASGERMMVSLEHAVFAALRARADDPGAVEEEILLRDGDAVTVTGIVLGGATVALANGQRARVLAGTEARPLRIRLG